MDNDQKKVQTEVDMAIAEVARLKTVASDLEKSNIATREAIEVEISILEKKIPALENDISIRVDILHRISEQVDEVQFSVDSTKKALTTVKENLSVVEKTLADRSFDLQTVESAIKNETSRFDVLLAEKTTELKNIKKAIQDAESLHDSNFSKHNIELLKTKKEMIDAERNLAEAKEEYEITSSTTNHLYNESIKYKNETGVLKSDVVSLSTEITNLKDERNNLTKLVAPLRAEIESEQLKLKVLVKERIQQHETNRSVVADLDQREATLRERYEEVGLDYK